MKTSLMTFSMMRDGFVKTIDADLLARIIKEGGYEEADIMEFEFRLYGEDALLAALQKYGIRLGCLITGLPFYTAPDQVEGGIRNALALAKKAGAKYLMIVPGANDAADQEVCRKLGKEEILRLTAEHFRKAVALTEPEGIQVIFENTPHAMKPLAAVEDVRWVLDAVPGLGLAFDTGNFRVADVHADELAAYELLKDEGEIAALIKPQFEAGKEKVGKKGVVRDPAVHLEVVENIVAFSRDLGFAVRGLTFSPVKGPEGNIEYLVWLCKDGAEGNEIEASLPGEIVREAHAVLDK